MTAVERRLPDHDLLERVLRNYGVERASETERTRFVSKHIELLESSENEAVARSGFVLRRAQDGFGLGYKVPLAVIAMGQTMLGLDLAVSAPFIATNPAAFTCAAIGAIYYGYAALSEDERHKLNTAVSAAIEAGVELVRSIVEFCIGTLKSVLDKQTLIAVRDFVAEYAQMAGSSLAEVTGKLSDKAAELGRQAIAGAEELANTVRTTASTVIEHGTARFGRITEKSKRT